MEWLTTLYEYLKELVVWAIDNIFLKLWDWLLDLFQAIIDLFATLITWVASLLPDMSSIGSGVPGMTATADSLNTGIWGIARWFLPITFWELLISAMAAWMIAHLLLVPLLRFLQVTK